MDFCVPERGSSYRRKKKKTNKNHSYKHNEQINCQNIDNSECFGVKYFVNIYPEMTSQ
jgi:hypothetical protein